MGVSAVRIGSIIFPKAWIQSGYKKILELKFGLLFLFYRPHIYIYNRLVCIHICSHRFYKIENSVIIVSTVYEKKCLKWLIPTLINNQLRPISLPVELFNALF